MSSLEYKIQLSREHEVYRIWGYQLYDKDTFLSATSQQ